MFNFFFFFNVGAMLSFYLSVILNTVLVICSAKSVDKSRLGDFNRTQIQKQASNKQWQVTGYYFSFFNQSSCQ